MEKHLMFYPANGILPSSESNELELHITKELNLMKSNEREKINAK